MSDEQGKNNLNDRETPPWLQPVPDDEGDSTGLLSGRKTFILATVAAVFLVVLFAAALLYLYGGADRNDPPRHIKAPEGEYRSRPADRGGMKIDHQDRKVFDRAAGVETHEDVALGKQPEMPLDTIPDDETPPNKTATSKNRGATPTVARAVPKARPETMPETTPETTPETSPKFEGPVYRVQLGAYGSEKSAGNAWRSVRAKFGPLVDGLAPEYESVSSGDRTLYRLRLTPLANRSAADALCVALRARDQACIVVKP